MYVFGKKGISNYCGWTLEATKLHPNLIKINSHQIFGVLRRLMNKTYTLFKSVHLGVSLQRELSKDVYAWKWAFSESHLHNCYFYGSFKRITTKYVKLLGQA